MPMDGLSKKPLNLLQLHTKLCMNFSVISVHGFCKMLKGSPCSAALEILLLLDH